MLLNLPIAQPKMMLADKGYDGDEVRSSLLMHGILPVIPPKANRKQAISCDFTAYKDRNRIERMFNRLKQFRRIVWRLLSQWLRAHVSSRCSRPALGPQTDIPTCRGHVRYATESGHSLHGAWGCRSFLFGTSPTDAGS